MDKYSNALKAAMPAALTAVVLLVAAAVVQNVFFESYRMGDSVVVELLWAGGGLAGALSSGILLTHLIRAIRSPN